jgi:hypothetical protein
MKSPFESPSIVLLRAVMIAVPVLAWLVPIVHGKSQDDRLLEGLRARRLFRLAESFCQAELARPDLGVGRQAELSIELSRAYAEEALNTRQDDAGLLWQQAGDAAAAFVRDHADSPWTAPVRMQGALVLVARGDLLRQQGEIAIGEDQQRLLAESRGHLRLAIRELVAVGGMAEELLRSAPAARRGPDELGRLQLLALQNNVRYQHARALKGQGACYPDGSADRTSALVQAVELLGPLGELDSADPLAWPSRLHEADCQRLLKDFEAAAQRLAAIEASDPPLAVRQRAAALRAKLSLDQGDLAAASAAVDAGLREDAPDSPELDFERFEIVLALWRQASEAKDQVQSRQREAEAEALVGHINQQHGGYWGRSAEAALAARIASDPGASSLAALVRAAEGQYRNGQVDAALVAYDRARAQAQADANPDEAFRLGYAAATIEHERKRHRAATDRYRQLALDDRKNPRAADAHLLAIYNLSQEALQSGPPALSQYAELLDEHLRVWPDGATVDEAVWLLGRLKEHEGKWSEAVAAYRRVSLTHARFPQAVEAAAECYARWLAELRAADQPTKDLSRKAASWYERLVLDNNDRPPATWNDTKRFAALTAARLWMEEPADYVRAERMVAALLESAGQTADAQRASARCLLVLALAGQGRFAEADRVLDDVTRDDQQSVEDLVIRLARLSATAPADRKKDLAGLELGAARLLGPLDESAGASRKAVELAQARALALAGRSAEAIDRYASLSQRHLDDGQIQEEYAQALLAGADRQSIEAALAKWQEVEKRSRPGGARWFRARFGLAVSYHRLEDDARAAKVITATEALYPALGGPDLKARFLKLLDEVQ